MSVPIIDPGTWVPLAVLTASLAGSGHCVSMCGGLVVASARSPSSWAAYHLGRLAGYLALGAAAGYVGGRALGASSGSDWLALASALALGLGFVATGVRVWGGKLPHVAILPAGALNRLYRRAGGNAALTGALTALLPCGWLHVFVLGAAGTRSAWLGAGFLLLFWLGTVPALTATPWAVDRIFRPIARKAPRLAATLLILSGALTVGAKVAPLMSGPSGSAPTRETSGEHRCH